MKMTSPRVVLALFVCVSAIGVLPVAGQSVLADESTRGCQMVVVRAYYDNMDMASEVNRWIDPWEINRDEGYLVVDVDQRGISRLESAGFIVEVDDDLTAMVCEPRLPLKGQKAGINGLPCYRTVDETFADVERLVSNHPDLAEWIDIGDSWELHSWWEPGY